MINKKIQLSLLLCASLSIVSCGSSSSSSNNTPNVPFTLPDTYTPNDGRLLGANCAQCHGTNGNSVNSWDSIAGENDLLDEFYEDENALMTAVAHGFTRTEVSLIGSWLKTVSKNDNEGEDDD